MPDVKKGSKMQKPPAAPRGAPAVVQPPSGKPLPQRMSAKEMRDAAILRLQERIVDLEVKIDMARVKKFGSLVDSLQAQKDRFEAALSKL